VSEQRFRERKGRTSLAFVVVVGARVEARASERREKEKEN